MSPWYRLFFSTNSASSLCSGCASCSTPAGQAIGPHTVSVHPSQPRHPTSAPASLHPLLVSPTSPSATPVNRPLSPVPPHPAPHTAPQPYTGTPSSDRHLAPFLPRSRLCLSRLARARQYQCQRTSYHLSTPICHIFTLSARPAHDESGSHHSRCDDAAWPSGYAAVGRQYCVRPDHGAAPSPATPHTH